MFLAKVTFWGQEKGGRLTPPQSGFRPQIQAGDVHTSCTVTSVDDTIIIFNFNKLTSVYLKLMYPDEYGDKLVVGDKVRLFEGNKQIAEGTILEKCEMGRSGRPHG